MPHRRALDLDAAAPSCVSRIQLVNGCILVTKKIPGYIHRFGDAANVSSLISYEKLGKARYIGDALIHGRIGSRGKSELHSIDQFA